MLYCVCHDIRIEIHHLKYSTFSTKYQYANVFQGFEKYLKVENHMIQGVSELTFTTPTRCSVFLPFLEATSASSWVTETPTTTYLW